MRSRILATALLVLAGAVPAEAAVKFTEAERRAFGAAGIDEPFRHSQAGGYLSMAETRFVRGVVNATTFPIDAAVCPGESILLFTHQPVLMALLNVPWSMAEGVARAGFRGFSGVFDVTTFWVPGIEGFAPPTGYGCQEVIWGPTPEERDDMPDPLGNNALERRD